MASRLDFLDREPVVPINDDTQDILKGDLIKASNIEVADAMNEFSRASGSLLQSMTRNYAQGHGPRVYMSPYNVDSSGTRVISNTSPTSTEPLGRVMERRYNDNYVNGTDTIDFIFENGAEVRLAVDATTNTDDLEVEARIHAMRNARMELTSDTARSTVDTARQRMDAMSQQMANNQEQMQSYTSYFEAAEQRMAQRQEDISSGSIRPFGQVGISEPPPRPRTELEETDAYMSALARADTPVIIQPKSGPAIKERLMKNPLIKWFYT